MNIEHFLTELNKLKNNNFVLSPQDTLFSSGEEPLISEETDLLKNYLNAIDVHKAEPEQAAIQWLLNHVFDELRKKKKMQYMRESGAGTSGHHVDYKVWGSTERFVGIEAKKLTDKTKVLYDMGTILKQYKNELKSKSKNQILEYLRELEYVVLTNCDKVAVFSKNDYNLYIEKEELIPCWQTTFHDFINKIAENDIYEAITRHAKVEKRDDLSRIFFQDLKKWYVELESVNFKNDFSRFVYLNQLVTAQILEDFWLIPARAVREIFSSTKKKWGHDPKKAIKKFVGELPEWLKDLYNTELFGYNVLAEVNEKEHSDLFSTTGRLLGFAPLKNSLFPRGIPSYNYTTISEDILGTAYEMFLVERRQEEGIVYTPDSIVEQMVNKVVDLLFTPLLAKMKTAIEKERYVEAMGIAKQITEIKILDLACGSGSFLLKLLKRLYKFYEELTNFFPAEPTNKTGDLWTGLPESMQQKIKTIREIKKFLGFSPYRLLPLIVLRHIFGADKDPMAVEIAKMNLWIEILKLGGPRQYAHSEIAREGFKNVLPDLDMNIVSGNSVLGGIYNDNENVANEFLKLRLEYMQNTFTPEIIDTSMSLRKEIRGEKDNVLWNIEFPFKFHAIIGNPPYVKHERIKDDKESLKEIYGDFFNSTSDLYTYFYKRAYELLLDGGYISFITSNKWLRAKYGENLRKLLLDDMQILEVVDLGKKKVFTHAAVDTIIFLVKKNTFSDFYDISYTYSKDNSVLISSSSLSPVSFTFVNSQQANLKQKIEQIGKPLKDWDAEIYYGIKTGLNEAFIINTITKTRLCQEDPKSAEILKPLLRGRDIKRYSHEWAGLWLIFVPWHFPLHKDDSIQGDSKEAESEFINQYPAIYKHLFNFKDKLEKRNAEETGIRYEWYALQRCANTYYAEFEKKKIVYPETTQGANFYLDEEGKYFIEKTGFILRSDKIQLKFLNGLFCSKLFTFIYKSFYPGVELGQSGYQYNKHAIEKTPIPPISTKNHLIVENIERLVDQISLGKKSGDNTTELEREIDRLVYQLYELTPEEIAIVESDCQK